MEYTSYCDEDTHEKKGAQSYAWTKELVEELTSYHLFRIYGDDEDRYDLYTNVFVHPVHYGLVFTADALNCDFVFRSSTSHIRSVKREKTEQGVRYRISFANGVLWRVDAVIIPSMIGIVPGENDYWNAEEFQQEWIAWEAQINLAPKRLPRGATRP